MAFITSTEMFKKSLKSDYAVGAFNVNNMEIIQGIVDAAKQEQAPIILQVSAGARKYAKPAYLLKLVEAAMMDTGLDICLHLDHGEDFEICKQCIDGGFTSVMIDGSKHPFEDNVALTKSRRIRPCPRRGSRSRAWKISRRGGQYQSRFKIRYLYRS